jgi:hypothetical protein
MNGETMQDEYALKNGINYRADGYAFCDRCGCNQIVNDRCLKCDVTPTEAYRKLADEIRSRCYRTSTGRIPGCYDGRPESFDTERAARILAAMRESGSEFVPVQPEPQAGVNTGCESRPDA